jgi:CelD/BcsL family acetyltransferase involved in cellulose biosynthesis
VDASVDIHGRLDAVAPEWDELAVAIGVPPFLRPGWFEAWWPAFGVGTPLLLTARRGSTLIGVLPLATRRGDVVSLSNWHSPLFAPIAVDKRARAALLEAMLDLAHGRASLAFVSADADIAAMEEHAARRGYRSLVRTLADAPRIRIDGPFDAYERRLNANLRRNLKRALRGLEAVGELALDIADPGADPAYALAEGLELERQGWKGERGVAIASRPTTARFYAAVARWAAELGLLRIVYLRLSGRAIGFHLAFEQDGVYWPLKGGFDRRLARFSPGIVLLEATVRRAFERGLRRYELGVGAEPYKLQWANEVGSLRLAQAFAPNVQGRVEHAAYAHGRPLALAVGLGRALGRVSR